MTLESANHLPTPLLSIFIDLYLGFEIGWTRTYNADCSHYTHCLHPQLGCQLLGTLPSCPFSSLNDPSYSADKLTPYFIWNMKSIRWEVNFLLLLSLKQTSARHTLPHLPPTIPHLSPLPVERSVSPGQVQDCLPGSLHLYPSNIVRKLVMSHHLPLLLVCFLLLT